MIAEKLTMVTLVNVILYRKAAIIVKGRKIFTMAFLIRSTSFSTWVLN